MTQIDTLAEVLKQEATLTSAIAAATQHDQSARYASLKRQYGPLGRRVTLDEQQVIDLGFTLAPLAPIDLPTLLQPLQHRAPTTNLESPVTVTEGSVQTAAPEYTPPSKPHSETRHEAEQVIVTEAK
jgi:hypothetical protein